MSFHMCLNSFGVFWEFVYYNAVVEITGDSSICIVVLPHSLVKS